MAKILYFPVFSDSSVMGSQGVCVCVNHWVAEGGQTEIAQLIFLLVKSLSHHHPSHTHTRTYRPSASSRISSRLLHFSCRTLPQSTGEIPEMKGSEADTRQSSSKSS